MAIDASWDTGGERDQATDEDASDDSGGPAADSSVVDSSVDSRLDDSSPSDVELDTDPWVPTANVIGVVVTGNAGSYRFAVTLRSDDTGCEQYANWWEVLSADGELIHRRILGHSHVEEQPFTRSSGPITVEADVALIVRAYMHREGDDGYGGTEYRGSAAEGFVLSDTLVTGASGVEDAEPQPSGCAF